MTGIEIIAAERERQINSEGWTPEHDDEHVLAEMTRAAFVYADLAAKQICYPDTRIDDAPARWPWRFCWWKPSTDPMRNIAKAGALLAAELDRLQRKMPHPGGPK